MIRIDTSNPPGGESELVGFLARLASEIGLEHTVFEIERGRPSLMARYRSPTTDGPTLLVNGHLDVVPVVESQWRVPPFAAIEQDGRIVGRGSCDMKGGIAASLEGLRACLDAGHPPACDVLFHLVADEETGGGYGTQSLVEAGLVAADACLVPEPTDLAIGVAERGTIIGEIHVQGVAGHGSEPAQGRSAILEAAKIVEALHLRRFDGRSHSLLGAPTCNIGTIEGGSSANVIASSCVLGFDRRFLPGQSPDELVSEIERVASTVTAAPVQLHVRTVVEASELDPDHRFVGFVRERCRRSRLPAEIIGSSLGSDARFVRNVLGIPAVVWGPGDPARAHTADEWVAVDDLVRAAAVFADMYATFGGFA